MKYEYELISHNYINGLHLFLVELLYRTPHMHRDFELNLILKGAVEIRSQGNTYFAQTGDFFVFDPYQPHELQAEGDPVQILSIQISPGFFSGYFPKMESIHFHTEIFHRAAQPQNQAAYRFFLEIARFYCKKEPLYELDCAQKINALFRALLDISAFTVTGEAERSAQWVRRERICFLCERIESSYCEKLLLSDLAEELGVSLYYLSHFFRDNFGISFQEYVAKLRCEKARRELLSTDRSLLDISLSCGFSNPKYFQKAFRERYGFTPREYRKMPHHIPSSWKAESILTMQKFLTEAECLAIAETLLAEE